MDIQSGLQKEERKRKKPNDFVPIHHTREACAWKTSSGEEFCSADRWPFSLTSMVDDRTATIRSAASSPLVPSTRRAGPNASFLVIFGFVLEIDYSRLFFDHLVVV